MKPTIATTLGALVGAVAALRRLAGLKLPMKPAYHLSKLQKLVNDEMEHFDGRRKALLARLGAERASTPDEIAVGAAERDVYVKPEHWPEFEQEMRDLLAVPVTIPWGPFDLSALEKEPITAGDLNALGLHTDGALVILPDPVPTPAETQAEKSI